MFGHVVDVERRDEGIYRSFGALPPGALVDFYVE
jgi:hypothetical protein